MRHPNRQTAPFALAGIPFIGGMIAQSFFGGGTIIVFILIGLFAAGFFRLVLARRSGRWVLVCLLMAALGSLVLYHDQQRTVIVGDQLYAATGTISKMTPTSRGGVKAVVRIHTLDHHKLGRQQRLLVLAYFPDRTAGLRDTIAFSAPLEVFPEQNAPWAFNSTRFYARQGITRRVFLTEQAYTLRPVTTFSLRRWGTDFRSKLKERLGQHLPDGQSRAIAFAMLLGDRNDISADTRDAFARSGAIHIMAISGLHIGIVAAILLWLVGRPKPGGRRWVLATRYTIVLAGIWVFTVMTGLSPSAVRAACMFSIYAIGVLAGRKSHGLNILGFCAVVSLMIEPRLLYSVSFQFSYLALTGILVFGTPVFRSLAVRNRVLRYAWGIVAVSISAQILLIPASVYYFNQVSLISPVTSIVAIPAAACIVGGGILLSIMTCVSPFLAGMVGGLLSQVISALNHLVDMAASLEWSAATELHLPVLLIPLAYLAIGALIMRILTAHPRYTYTALLLSIAFITLYTLHKKETRSEASLVFYATEAEFQLDWFIPGSYYSTVDPALNFYQGSDIRRSRRSRMASSHNEIPVPLPAQSSTICLPGPLRIGYWPEGSPPEGQMDILFVGAGIQTSWPGEWPQARIIVAARTISSFKYRSLQKRYDTHPVAFHHLKYDGHFEFRPPQYINYE